ncbi:MAG: DUF4932 domain-containing protein [Flavobacteriales bacterium]|nr:DUF4932 domain-containing protein [Flavobacteriales bacterium]
MIKHLTLLLLLFLTFSSHAQNILEKPKVDERIELLSIVFRLADCWEYSSKDFPVYVTEIENHFSSHKNHSLIKYIKQKVRKNGVGFDAVMKMAISISEPPNMTPLLPFSNEFPDKRWGEKRATKFLELLNQFYVDADCKTFFEKNQEMYQKAAAEFTKVYEELDLDWYQQFYGAAPKGEFRIINGLGNGGGNYGPKIKIDDKEIIYAIMGSWSVDSTGHPIYPSKSYFPTLLHEFNHSFVNHVVEKFHPSLEKSGETLFKHLQAEMESQAYGSWETMFAEAVVRAAVIKYLQDHNYDSELVQLEINDEIDKGFVWTDELVKELNRYDKNRNTYPTLESFMPELVTFFQQVAINIEETITKVEEKRPNVISITPFENGNQQVDPSTQKIEITFDKELIGKGHSILKGNDTFPEFGDIEYSADRKTIYLNINLKENTKYEFILSGWKFKSTEGFSLKDYPITFKTTK